MIKKCACDLSINEALLLFCLNIFTAGGGTFFSGLLDHKGYNGYAIGLGLLQIILVPLILVGWIWGIWHGYALYIKAKIDQAKNL